MTDHAATVPTAAGPVGVVVSEPEGRPRAALALLQGGGPPCRAGVNAIWARIARDLVARGIAVMRFDFATEGESAMVGVDPSRPLGWRRNADLAIMRELAPWFRERTATEELLLAGSCHGGRIAFDFAAEDPGVSGTFLIVPYLWNLPPNMRADKQLNRSKTTPRAVQLYDRGSSDVDDYRENVGEVEAVSDESPLEETFVKSCRAALEHGPVWIMIGEGDGQKPVELKRRLGAAGKRLEVETVPEKILHPIVHPEVQSLVRERLVERITAVTRHTGPPGAQCPRH